MPLPHATEKGIKMKKLMALVMVMTLVMGAVLVSCVGDKETESDYQDLQTNSTEWETFPDEPEENDVLGIGADTDDSWGPIQKN